MQGRLAGLMPQIGGFFSWWGQELHGLLPTSLLANPKSSLPALILSVEDGGLRLLVSRAPKAGGLPQISGAVLPEEEIFAYLGDLNRSNPIGSIGLRIPYRECFARSLELPAAASQNVGALVAMNFERATPFKAKDVLTAHYIEPTQPTPGKLLVRQLIIKRSAIGRLQLLLEAAGIELKAIDCWNESRTAALPVNFLQQSGGDTLSTSQGRRIVVPLVTGAALLLCMSATYLFLDKHEEALERLQAQTTLLKIRAQRARDAQARSQAELARRTNLYRLRNEAISKVSLLEELTRLLPDNAYVTDLKIEGGTVDISGLAKGAAGLIPILERSSIFVDATSTAPLTFDQQQDKERFSIRAHVRNAAPAISKPQDSIE
jgi:general secretion pathway protein L